MDAVKHRIVSAEKYSRLLNTARLYRDPAKRADLDHKPLAELKAYYEIVGTFDKQGDELLIFEVPEDVKAEIINTRLRPEDRANPEALQRFAGSWYFAAFRDLRTALNSAIASKAERLF